jgi:hypothetical protein
MPMRTWKILPAIFLALLLGGCLTTEAEKSSAKVEYSSCIMAAVARLDDGKSDPVSIAYGVSGQCSVQYNKLSDAMIGDMITENGQAYMRDQMRNNELKLASSAVLTYRAAHNHKDTPAVQANSR